MLRTYVTLVEEVVDAKYGDIAYVLLGFEEARTPREARQTAREKHGIEGGLIAVPAGYWSTDD